MVPHFQDTVIKTNYIAIKGSAKLESEGNEIQVHEYNLCGYLLQAHDVRQKSCQKNVMWSQLKFLSLNNILTVKWYEPKQHGENFSSSSHRNMILPIGYKETKKQNNTCLRTLIEAFTNTVQIRADISENTGHLTIIQGRYIRSCWWGEVVCLSPIFFIDAAAYRCRTWWNFSRIFLEPNNIHR